MPLNCTFKNDEVGKLCYIYLTIFLKGCFNDNFIFSFKMVIRKMHLKRTYYELKANKAILLLD